MSKDATQTSTVRPDAATSQYQDMFRKLGLGAIGGLIGNDQLKSYAGGLGQGFGAFDANGMKSNIRSNFDLQRQNATLSANDLATKAGAFGGNRSAILQSQLTNDVNRNEANALQGVDQEQFQRLMSLMGLAQGGFGTPGSTQSTTMPSNPWGTALGLGTLATGMGWSPFSPGK